jgi:signal transduction histidine kinase/ActR/RegA family two-component response regulator
MDMVGGVSGTVFLWDANDEVLVPAAWHGFGPWRGETRLTLGEAIAGTVAQRREGLIVNDFRRSPYARRLMLERTAISAVLGAPLLYRDRLVGAITLDRHGDAPPFTEQNLTVLTLFAVHAAIAIENARAHDEARQLARQLATLTRLTQSLVAKTRADAVGQEVMRAVTALMPGAAARLWDLTGDDRGALTLMASVGLQDARGGIVRFRQGEGLAGVAAITRRTVVSRNLLQDPRFINKAWAAREGLVSALVSPLVAGDTIRGILAIFTRTPHAFSESETSVFESLAAHAAIALDDASLHEAAERRGNELEALLRAARALMAGLDLRQVLDRIVTEAGRIAGAPHVKILLVEEGTHELRVGSVSGALVQHDFPKPFGQSLSGAVAATGQPLFVADSQDESANPNAAFDRQHGLRTYLGLPVKIRDEILGVLTFNTTESKVYSAAEMAYLHSFADQAALAIENARLYERVQQQAADLEARVRERTAELEKALRVKGEFLAKMSHEFRTPLNFIIGFTDLLRQESAGPLTPKQRQFLGRVHTGAAHLLGMVEDLLDLSLVEGGKTALRLEKIPVLPLVQEVLESFGVQAGQKDVRLEFVVKPELAVVADQRRLFQILTNLVGNAVKFTSDGGSVSVLARTLSTADRDRPITDGPPVGPGWVEFVVRDTGIGIAPADLERIFVGFEQGDNATTRRHGGAGIGLAVVRTLVHLHGGLVWAESDGVGRGARFTVRLPPLAASPKPRVLVVEDEAAILKALSVFLRDAGFAVEGAATARAALEAVAARPPDVIVLNLGLPDLSGWEVLRAIRDANGPRTVPVLILSGPDEDERETARAMGADEFVAKPASPSVVASLVQDLLLRGAHRAALTREPDGTA